MEEANIFQSEVHYDLATYKDFNRINTYTLPRITLCGLIYLVCMIYLLSMMEHSFTAKTVLALSLFALGMWAYQWFRNRDGGIPYKRMLRNNKDEIPRYLITVDENGITTKNLTSENEITNSFSQIRYMLESQRLLILVDDLKTAHIIDKSTLTGGGRDALVCFLRKHCPSLKKRVRKGVLGRILWYLMRILPILMLLISIASLFQIPEKLRGQITGNVSYEEIAEDLLPLGIEISPEAISELNQYAGENPLDIISDGTIKVLNLLCWEGQGRFEKNVFYQEGPMEAYDWSWVPSTSGVYWFDLEVMDCSAIYTDFLRGVEAMDENLSFTNVTEDYSAVDMESGMGIVTFSFDHQDQHYTLNAQYQYDWFDTNMLIHMGRILQQDSDPKDLWYTFDGQGVLLYYGTVEEATALKQKTGLVFLDPVRNPLYG